MSSISRGRSLLRNLFRRRRVNEQLDDEVRAYVEMLAEQREAAGVTRREAWRSAQAEVGGIEQVKQSVRDSRTGAGLEQIAQDVRFGLRQLRRSPGYTATALITLALSIGVNTAIFSVVNALVVKSLPYSRLEDLGTIYTRIRGQNATDERHNINGEQWELLRDQVPALIAGASGTRPAGVNLEAGGRVEYVSSARVSAHYLDVLGVQSMIGRGFTDEEDRPHGPHVAIVSASLWQNLFHNDRTIVGRPVRLKGELYTVVGVLSPDVTTPLNAEIYTPLEATRDGEGGGTNFACIVRLRDGATWQEADAQINHVWLKRKSLYELEDNPGAQLSYHSVPLAVGLEGKLRPEAKVLMLAAGLILLIACGNLAALTLVRMTRRTGEVATRLALGASGWRIQRQFWMENLLLGLGGAAAGIAVGYLALHGLLRLLPEDFLPVARVTLDGRVLLFTLGLSVLTSVLTGMLPALAARRADLRDWMAKRGANSGGGSRVRPALVAGEIALTMVLLAASGLLIRTLIHLETLPAGFNPDGVMTARASLDDVRFHDLTQFRALLSQSTEAMRSIPGVVDAAVGLSLPFERSMIMGGIQIGGSPQQGMADMVYVTPTYFSTLQIPILRGRGFTDADSQNAPKVVVVNELFVRQYLTGGDPIGRSLNKDLMVVGVVEDVAMAPGMDPVAPMQDEATVYMPAAQAPAGLVAMAHVWFQPSWIVRTARPVEGLTAQMQRALNAAAPNLPFSGFYRMSDLQARTLAQQRVEVALLTSMAALALLLSGVGVFALVASMVGQRTREFGIRMALGSSVGSAMAQAGSSGLRAALWGMLIGAGACAGTLRVMRSALYGVTVYDARTLAAAGGLMAVAVLTAAMVPTLRVAKIDPARILREE